MHTISRKLLKRKSIRKKNFFIDFFRRGIAKIQKNEVANKGNCRSRQLWDKTEQEVKATGLEPISD